jgi:type IV pilus assembly protein PilX
MPSAEAGAALVVALVLLLVLTLLAITGARMSVAELVMAGNEQFRHKASTAASAGIEVAVARVSARGSGQSTNPENIGPIRTGEPLTDMFSASVRYAGKEASLPGSSADKFTGHHFEIESTGSSARNARDVQLQGLMVVSPVSGVQTFHRLGDGLGSEVAP